MKKALAISLAVLAISLVSARIALPIMAKRQINASLAKLEGYGGRVEDVDFALWRGRVALESLEIRDAKKEVRLALPYVSADIAWGPLLKRTLVADVAVRRPELRLTAPKPQKAAGKVKEKARKTEEAVEKETGKTLAQLLEGLMPFRIDRFSLKDGLAVVQEGPAGAEARLSDIDIVVENLTNSAKAKKGAFAAGSLSAKIMDQGRMEVHLKLDPTAERPAFDLDAQVRGLDMAALSPVFRWQWDVEVERGEFEMVCEAAAEGGGFHGYVKPFLKDFKMGSRGKKSAGAAKKIKRAVVNAVARVLENEDTKAVATKVPFKGRFDDPEIGVWDAVLAVLRNAFIEALQPTFEKA